MAETIIKFKNTEFKLHPRTEADISVMREIFKLHEYRVADEIIATAIDPIVDAGAHIGFFSLYARALNPTVPIFAIEPESDNLKLLAKHLKDNKIKKVEVVAGALAGAVAITGEGGQRFLAISEDSHNHHLLGVDEETDGKKIKIKTFSLADFCRTQKIKKISLLKMDIEGGEFEVVRNLSAEDFFLFKTVILEYHNSEENNYRELENILREHGFGVQIFPSRFDKTMGFIFARNKRI